MRISDWSSDVCSSDLDREQTVLEAGIAGLDEVRKLEAPLECTRRDAAVQIFPLAVVLGTRAGDGDQVLRGDDLDIFGSAARARERDAAAALAILPDVEGRIAVILARPCRRSEERRVGN